MTDAPRLPIRSVAVLGDGLVGLSAAIAFARALPDLLVTVIATPPDPAALADRMPGSLPSIGDFHDRIGITEEEAVAAGATHRIGTLFSDWAAEGRSFVHAFGDHGRPVGPGAFHQHWLNARRRGEIARFDSFSAAATLARAGRFVHPDDDPASPLSRFEYALRLDPPRYRELLLRHAQRRGMAIIDGRLDAIEHRADGGIAALRLHDGRRVEADLFLDCGGPSAPLHSSLDGSFEEWSATLPCDRMLIAQGPVAPLTPCDEVMALDAGWRWSAPLRDRTMVGLCFASAATSGAEAERLFGHPSEAIVIRPGFRDQPWRRNVLALGDAAVAVNPLEWTNLHLAQSAILRALDLLPGRDCHTLEVAEYNRRTRQQAERVRDFIAAHYRLASHRGGSFWKAAAQLAPSPGLAHTLDHFERRGRLPYFEDESFGKESWLAVLLGLGLVPRASDPITSTADPRQVEAAMRALARSISGLPAAVPPYADYLSQVHWGTRMNGAAVTTRSEKS